MFFKLVAILYQNIFSIKFFRSEATLYISKCPSVRNGMRVMRISWFSEYYIFVLLNSLNIWSINYFFRLSIHDFCFLFSFFFHVTFLVISKSFPTCRCCHPCYYVFKKLKKVCANSTWLENKQLHNSTCELRCKDSLLLCVILGGIERNFSLGIDNVQWDDQGDYNCVAINQGGMAEKNITLTFSHPTTWAG